MSTEVDDFELLREYRANQSESAFRTLVERHVNMVYATALRQVGDAHLAEEATQAVFIALAKKADGLSSSTILAGWLFRAAQFAAAKFQRSEIRRKHWEQQAAQMEPNPSDSAAAWEQMAPQLNEALNELKEPDRDALILRFFESKSMAQVGCALGTTEGAAKMRIARALEQLRGIFHARGIVLPVTLLAAALSTSATQAAPVGLAAAITASALLKSTSIPIITKGLLLFMNWNTNKLAIAAIVVLSLTTITSTTLLGVVLWKYSRPVAVASAPVGAIDAEFSFTGDGPGELNLRKGKDGTVRMRTPNGDVIVTNVVNYVVTTDEQGNRREMSIVTNDNGSIDQRITVRKFRGASGSPVRVRAGGGAGAAGFGTGGDGHGDAFGGETKVEEDVLAPPAPPKP